jgi:hypothetical protein
MRSCILTRYWEGGRKMRRANDSKFLVIGDVLVGINLGADLTSEHEWGIKEIKQLFGIPQGEKDFGIKRRKIVKVPSSPIFDWNTGADKGSEGFYLYDTWDGKKPSFANYGELKNYRGSLACAWDEKSFGIFSTDKNEIAYLREIFTAFQSGDGAIFLGGGGMFQNSGLCLAIASRIPQDFLDGWYKADKEYYDMDQVVEATGIRQLLKEKGKRYFALSRPTYRKADGILILLLNPIEQQDNNFGWFTIDDLREWADGKGPIPINKDAKKAQR